MDQISDKKNKEENWIENLSLKEALKRLDVRERNIVEMRFYEGRTQMEVAQEIGISQAQVSRLEKHALKSMRTYLRAWFSSYFLFSLLFPAWKFSIIKDIEHFIQEEGTSLKTSMTQEEKFQMMTTAPISGLIGRMACLLYTSRCV